MSQAILAAHGFTSRAISDLFDWFKDLKKSYVFHRQVRSTMKELSKLNDRELNDIGISRGDIYAIAHGDVTMRRCAEMVEENPNLKGWS